MRFSASPLGPRDVRRIGVELIGHQRRISSSVQTLRLQLLHEQEKGFHVWGRPVTRPGMDGWMDQREVKSRPLDRRSTAGAWVSAPLVQEVTGRTTTPQTDPLVSLTSSSNRRCTPNTQCDWLCQTVAARWTSKTGPGLLLGECNALLQQQSFVWSNNI